MTMIDCHAHAFPTLSEMADNLPPGVADVLRAAVSPMAQAFADEVANVVPGGQRLKRLAKSVFDFTTRPPVAPSHPSDVAAMRAKLPKHIAQGLEYWLTMNSAPRLLVEGSIEQLMQSMHDNGIEKTVLIGAPPIANADWVLEQARIYEGRIVPVVNIPVFDEHAPEHAWSDALSDLAARGAAGFKIHPNFDPYGEHHPAVRAVFEVAQKTNKFVILHTGCFGVASYIKHHPAEPADYQHLFTAYPDVRVCLAHMNRENPERAWEMMRRHDQLWTDTSWQTPESIRRAVDTMGDERILLGSDWPLLTLDLQRDSAKNVQDGLGPTLAEKITSTNARTFLQL